jgi:hypothetical protein
MEKISFYLIKIDAICDCIPIASTVINFVDLFQKCVILQFIRAGTIINNPYYHHLQKKSFLRCVILLVPILGKVAVDLYDFSIKTEEEDRMAKTLDVVLEDGLQLQAMDQRFKNNFGIAIAAVQQNGLALEHVGGKLRGNVLLFRKIVLAAVRQNGLVLRDVGEKLQGDTEIILAAVTQNGLALEHVWKERRAESDILAAAIMQNPEAVQFLSPVTDEPALEVLTLALKVINEVQQKSNCAQDMVLRFMTLRTGTYSVA